VPGPVGAEDCPDAPDHSRRLDAGSSWESADWPSTLYNHAMTPNASPSCVASDGRTARMGASSNHANRVNVLMLGGSVRGFTPTVDPEVWKKFGGATMKERAGR
jgi:prepilin-type processing-associated H-X9-DG protein